MHAYLLWVAYGLVLAGAFFAALAGIGWFEYKRRILSAKVVSRQYGYLGVLVVMLGLLIGVSIEVLLLR